MLSCLFRDGYPMEKHRDRGLGMGMLMEFAALSAQASRKVEKGKIVSPRRDFTRDASMEVNRPMYITSKGHDRTVTREGLLRG